MRTYNRDLKKARRWLASGRSTRVIHFLEPKVPLFLEDPNYYALLGRAYFNNMSYGDADTYLNRGLQADPGHLDVRLILAVNHLKRKDPASAVRSWLEILEDYPGQKQAGRGLRALKRISSQEQQDRFIEKFDPRRFLPMIASPWPPRILGGLTIVLAVLLVLYFRDPIGEFLSRLAPAEESRPGAEALVIERGTVLSGGPEDAVFFMSDGEISRTLNAAVKDFREYRDNSARRELNRIILSNASDDIRSRAVQIRESLGKSDIDSLETDFSYAEVIADPALYEGCYVLWRGKTANITEGGDVIRFDFLVGFDDGTVYEGTLPVEMPFLAVMEPLPLELLARVENRPEGIVLIAETLHFLR